RASASPMARPIPIEAPVTTATLSRRFIPPPSWLDLDIGGPIDRASEQALPGPATEAVRARQRVLSVRPLLVGQHAAYGPDARSRGPAADVRWCDQDPVVAGQPLHLARPRIRP